VAVTVDKDNLATIVVWKKWKCYCRSLFIKATGRRLYWNKKDFCSSL